MAITKWWHSYLHKSASPVDVKFSQCQDCVTSFHVPAQLQAVSQHTQPTQGRWRDLHVTNEGMEAGTQDLCMRAHVQRAEGGREIMSLVERLHSIVRMKAQEGQHLLSMS